MKKHVWTESLVKGQKVLVSHLQGEEEGEIEGNQMSEVNKELTDILFGTQSWRNGVPPTFGY